MMKKANIKGDKKMGKMHKKISDEKWAEIVSEYKKARAKRTPEQKAEELFEKRAAFGRGQKIVNIITGEVTET